MTDEDELRGYLLRTWKGRVLPVVAHSRNQAKHIGEHNPELYEPEYTEIRVKLLQPLLDEDVDWSEYGKGTVPLLDMLKKGLHGWVENVDCPVCGAEFVRVRRDDEFGLHCEECREDESDEGVRG